MEKLKDRHKKLTDRIATINAQISNLLKLIDEAQRKGENAERNHLPTAAYKADELLYKGQIADIGLTLHSLEDDLQTVMVAIDQGTIKAKKETAKELLSQFPEAVKKYNIAAAELAKASIKIDQLCLDLKQTGEWPALYGPCELSKIPKYHTEATTSPFEVDNWHFIPNYLKLSYQYSPQFRANNN